MPGGGVRMVIKSFVSFVPGIAGLGKVSGGSVMSGIMKTGY